MTSESIVAGKRSLRAIIATVIALFVVISIFTTTALAETLSSYDVKIVDSLNEKTITTNETEPVEILKSAGITLGSKDKLDISSFEKGKGGTIRISRLNNVLIDFDNNIKTYQVYSATVGSALKEIGLTVNKKDKTNYSLNSAVKDGMIIKIDTAFYVTLSADGDTEKYAIVNGTVSDLLKLSGTKLDSNDYTKPSLKSKLKDNMKVKVYRVEYKKVKKKKKIKYKTKKVKDKTLEEGKTKTVKKGVKGKKEVTYKIKYVNGKKKDKSTVSEKIISKPVKKVVKVGTKKVDYEPNGVTERNGYKVGEKISGRYTHYCACATCNGNSNGITSSGKRISNGMKNPYYVACNWLPLGSVISVDGTNYTVVDRGGSGLSRKGRIDIFTPEGHSECYRLGTGSCSIEILRLGW